MAPSPGSSCVRARTAPRRVVPVVLALALGWGAPAAAQNGAPPPDENAAAPTRCVPIGKIEIRNNSLFAPEEIEDKDFAWALGAVNRIHIRTRSDYLRRALLISEGGCFDERALAASVRNIRELDFIARAESSHWQQEDSTFAVRVETWDEWSTTANIDFDVENSLQFKGFLLAEKNLFGRGLKASFRSRTFREQRNNNFTVATTRLFGTRSQASVAGGTTRIGSFWRQDVWRPWQTEGAELSFQSRLQYEDREHSYLTGDLEGLTHVLLPLTDRTWYAKLTRRFGEPGDLTVVGLEVDALRRTQNGPVRQVLNREFADATPASDSLVAELASQSPGSWFRLGAEVGIRRIRFTTAKGLDLIEGVQTVAHGAELTLTLGRTLGSWGTSTRDTYAHLDGYASAAGGPFLVNGTLRAEGRRMDRAASGLSAWRDLGVRGRMLLYVQPPQLPGNTLHTGVRFNLRRNQDQPYQVALGGGEGVRGYQEEDLPTSSTLVLFAEDRVNLPWFRPAVGLGLTGFVDYGRGWGGRVPFGIDTRWRASVGGGLRVAFPAGSGTVTRLEVAWPLGPLAAGRGPVIRTYWSPVTTRR